MLILTIIPQFFFFLASLGIQLPSSSTIPKQSMALTAEEFLRISKLQRAEDAKIREEERAADKKIREEEKAADMRIRSEERAADLAKINIMIESGVKAEVERVIEPIQVRNNERFGILEAEMVELKDLLKSGPRNLSPKVQPTQVHPPVVPTHDVLPSPVQDDVTSTLSKAKRIISLQPIHWSKDVERQKRQYENINSNDEAMHSAVMEYLRCELKIRDSDVPRIVSIFPPANTSQFDRLYVEFENEYSADFVAGFARVLRKRDHQVSIYVPRCFQPRFQAFNAYAKSVRTAPGLNPGDIKTKIKYGKTDFTLLTKSKNGRWTEDKTVPLSFPPFLPSSASVSSEESPPPGRSRGSPSPLPPSKKRGAPSPLERLSKASKSSENLVSDPSQSPIPQQTPGTPPHTPTLALSGGAILASPTIHSKPSSPSPSYVSVPSFDSGVFGQTAVCSPRLSTNKHFTFETDRRLSLPAAPGEANLN